MSGLGDLANALSGIAGLATGRPDAGRHFRSDHPGLLVALGWFVAAVVLSVAVQSVIVGLPSLTTFLFGLLTQLLTIGALAYATSRLLRLLKLNVPLNRLLVPMLYALALMFLVAIPLTLVTAGAGLLAILAAGYVFFRAGQLLAGMALVPAIGFAALGVTILVVVPNALYMLSLQIPAPA